MVLRARRTVIVAALAALLGTAAAAWGAGSPGGTLPQPAAINQLASVACIAAADCWAVGSAQTLANKTSGEILRWDGSTWATVSAPPKTEEIGRLSCLSASECWALTTGSKPLLRWDGSTWGRLSTPSLHNAYLASISCAARADCWAVGASRRGDAPLALHWYGSRWTQIHTPLAADKYGTALESVTCTTRANCWAFGNYYAAPLTPTVTNYLVGLHWNGSTWSKVWTSKPYPGGDSSISVLVTGVYCSSSSWCLATGASGIPGVTTRALALRWNGRTWAAVATPHIRNAWLSSLACTSTHNCWAVGFAGNLSGRSTLALRWNGSDWKRVAVGRGDSLSGVSCTSSSNCWAVGDAPSSSNGQLNLAEHWNGATWTTG